jgi:hypothetical protein
MSIEERIRSRIKELEGLLASLEKQIYGVKAAIGELSAVLEEEEPDEPISTPQQDR